MSSKYPGGIISKTAPTPSGPYDTSTAPGVWTLEQQAYWQKLGQWPTQGNSLNYIEDVFSTYLYTGNGTTQTITNGIDLSTKGGAVWIKGRNQPEPHVLVDTVRGAANALRPNSSAASINDAGRVSAFTTSGFTTGADGETNGSGTTYASWTFREQAKFFDVVTYTGDGVARTIAHNLGSVPGCMIIKRTDAIGSWAVYHRSLASGNALILEGTSAAFAATYFNSTAPTSTVFSVGAGATVNASGGTYVAYLFAHNAGGFGPTQTDNVISCGTFTADASGNASVNLGYEPQWVLFKASTSTQQWFILDNMRGFYTSVSSGPDAVQLIPNAANAEAGYGQVGPTATGFNTTQGQFGASETYIYVAIRRGPMKTPTVGTSVFSTSVSSADTGVITSGFVTDMALTLDRTSGGTAPYNRAVVDRLRSFRNLSTATTAAEVNNTSTVSFQQNNGIYLNGGGVYANGYVYEQFKRAPGFFDEVCWAGTGSYAAQNHNLGVPPELVIQKARTSIAGANDWFVNTATQYGYLNLTTAFTNFARTLTSTTFQPVADGSGNWVTYLFATLAGVSKVGTYSGTGAAQTINCGFTTGARFVLIKRTDSTGDWYVWDSARGIIPSNDPYLLLNSTAAETTGTDYVDTTSVGFDITSTAPAAINANGGTFIFLAIA